MTVLPLRAILIGDILPFDREVVEKMTIGTETEPTWVELTFSDGHTFTGHPDTTLTVAEISIGL
jgi:hypothetical protein